MDWFDAVGLTFCARRAVRVELFDRFPLLYFFYLT